MIEIIQGDNPTIKTDLAGFSAPEDLTDLIANTRATASFEAHIVAGATALATTIKLDAATAQILKSSPLGAGVRARIRRTGEYVLITAVDGQNATITRAQLDPGGVAGPVAALILANDTIYILGMDAIPVSSELDPADTTNQTALVRFDPATTRIPATNYSLQIVFQDTALTPGRRVTYRSPEEISIIPDPNAFGV